MTACTPFGVSIHSLLLHLGVQNIMLQKHITRGFCLEVDLQSISFSLTSTTDIIDALHNPSLGSPIAPLNDIHVYSLCTLTMLLIGIIKPVPAKNAVGKQCHKIMSSHIATTPSAVTARRGKYPFATYLLVQTYVEKGYFTPSCSTEPSCTSTVGTITLNQHWSQSKSTKPT
jgi:hypothetical protein